MQRSLIIICNFNGKELLRKCLRSLNPELSDEDDVLVVENGSSDGSAAMIREEFSWVKLLELPENRGFTGGNNAALQFAQVYRYFVLLNNDIEVEPGFLEALLNTFITDRHLERSASGVERSSVATKDYSTSRSTDVDLDAQNDNEKIGLASAVILTADGTRVDHAGGKWLSFLSGTNIGDFRNADPTNIPDEPFETVYASGAALAIPTTFVKRFGLFPDFFAYYEDVDLSWRVRNAGYRIVVAPQSRVRHLGSATSGKNRPLFERYAARNRIWLYRRNLPWWQKPIVLPMLIAARLLLLLPSIGNWEILKARASGLWEGIVSNIPNTDRLNA